MTTFFLTMLVLGVLVLTLQLVLGLVGVGLVVSQRGWRRWAALLSLPLVVPMDAFNGDRGNGSATLRVLRDGRVEQRAVKLGLATLDAAEITRLGVACSAPATSRSPQLQRGRCSRCGIVGRKHAGPDWRSEMVWSQRGSAAKSLR